MSNDEVVWDLDIVPVSADGDVGDDLIDIGHVRRGDQWIVAAADRIRRVPLSARILGCLLVLVLAGSGVLLARARQHVPVSVAAAPPTTSTPSILNSGGYTSGYSYRGAYTYLLDAPPCGDAAVTGYQVAAPTPVVNALTSGLPDFWITSGSRAFAVSNGKTCGVAVHARDSDGAVLVLTAAAAGATGNGGGEAGSRMRQTGDNLTTTTDLRVVTSHGWTLHIRYTAPVGTAIPVATLRTLAGDPRLVA